MKKNLKTYESLFVLEYVYYSLYRPPEDYNLPRTYVGHGEPFAICGSLAYTLKNATWWSEWQGNNIISRPIGASYFTNDGTMHIVTAAHRFQIGNHKVTLNIRTELEITSNEKSFEFEIEILDCIVELFDAGAQNVRDLEISKG